MILSQLIKQCLLSYVTLRLYYHAAWVVSIKIHLELATVSVGKPSMTPRISNSGK